MVVAQELHRAERATARRERRAVAVTHDDYIARLAAEGRRKRGIRGRLQRIGVRQRIVQIVWCPDDCRRVRRDGAVLCRRRLRLRSEVQHPDAQDKGDQDDADQGVTVDALFHDAGADARASGTEGVRVGFSARGLFMRRRFAVGAEAAFKAAKRVGQVAAEVFGGGGFVAAKEHHQRQRVGAIREAIHEAVLMMAVGFAHEPLEAVTADVCPRAASWRKANLHRRRARSDVLARYHPVAQLHHPHIQSPDIGAGVVEEGPDETLTLEVRRAWKAKRAIGHGHARRVTQGLLAGLAVADGEFVAALGAAAREDTTAGLGGHSRAEAVLVSALAAAGLVGALHVALGINRVAFRRGSLAITSSRTQNAKRYPRWRGYSTCECELSIDFFFRDLLL